jgi:hypothetical protein
MVNAAVAQRCPGLTKMVAQRCLRRKKKLSSVCAARLSRCMESFEN